MTISFLTALLIAPCFAATPATRGTSQISSFEFCFATNHGRCFRTVQNSAGTITLLQYGGLSDSKAVIAESDVKFLEQDIVKFYSKTAYAKAKKIKVCAKPLTFRILAGAPVTENIRCLERLKRPDSEKLLSLVTRISLSSKPL